MLKNVFKKMTVLQNKLKHHLFETPIEKHKLKTYRKEKRQADEEELRQFKFYLFVIYTLIFVIPIIFIVSIFFG